MTGASSSWLPGALVVAGVLVLATACSSAASKADPIASPSIPIATPSTPTPTPTPTPTGPVAPLTGLLTTPAILARPVIAVSVAGSAPAGLAQADIVYEEMSDGLRWVALYQSTDTTVSAVGQARPMDPTAIADEKPVYVFAGAQKGVLTVVDKATLVPADLTMNTTLFAGPITAPTIATATIRGAFTSVPGVPLLPYRAATDPQPAANKPASKLVLAAAGQPTQVWSYDRASHVWKCTSGGPAVATANLVVQVVTYKSVQLSHPNGAYVPSARVLGTGTSDVFSGPSVVTGTWRKGGAAAATSYSDAHGIAARMLPGSTWILLAPVGATVTIS